MVAKGSYSELLEQKKALELNKLQSKLIDISAKRKPYQGNDNDTTCEVCGGSGWLSSGEGKLRNGEFISAKLILCQDSSHDEQRLKAAAKRMDGIGLSVNDLKLSIDDLEIIHQNEIVEYKDFDGVKELHKGNKIMIEAFKKIVDDPLERPLVYLLGGYGCGKTHWAKSLTNEVSKRHGMACEYTTVNDLVLYLNEGYSDNGVGYLERNQAVARLPFLIMDEFDFSESKFKDTDHNRNWLGHFLTKRIEMSETSTTIIIGNVPMELAGYGSINSRLKEFFRMYNTAPDYRGRRRNK